MSKNFNTEFKKLIKAGYLLEVEPGKFCLALKKGCLNCAEVNDDTLFCKVQNRRVEIGELCNNFEPNETYKSIEQRRH